MGTISEKLTYLDETRENIRQSINSIGGNLTNSDTFRSYSDAIDEIYEKFPKVEGEGSNITLENTMEASIKSELDGNTSQEGTPTPDSPQPINVVSGRQEVSVVGKNLLDYDNQTISNALIQTLTREIVTTSQCTCVWAKVQPNTTYTMSRNNGDRLIIGGSNTQPNLNSKLDTIIYDGETSTALTYTFNSGNHTYITIYISRYDSSKPTQVQLEKGSTATEYEEYKGQSYEINLGKNLLPNTNTTQVLNNITFTKNDDDSIKMNGTANANTSYRINTLGNELSLPAGTYTISTGNNLTSGITLQGWHSTATNFVTIQSSSNKASFTLTSDVSNVRFQIFIANGTQISNLTIYPMLEKGSQATSYSPYKTPIELCKIGTYQDRIFRSEGKNLWDEEYVGIQNDLIYKAIYVGDGTFTLSTTMPKTTSNFTNLFFLAGNVSTGASTQNNGVSYGTPITQQSIDGYITIAYRNSENLSPVDYTTMLNEGSTTLPYEPYNSKGKWLLHKEIGKVVLDGSENWDNFSIESSGLGRAIVSGSNVLYGDNKNTIMASNMVGVQYSGSWSNTYDCIASYSNNKFIAYLKNASDLATFKSILNNSNAIVYYVLATPTYTEITDSELIEQLAEFGDAKSYEGTTNINVDGDLPIILNVKALEDIFSQ